MVVAWRLMGKLQAFTLAAGSLGKGEGSSTGGGDDLKKKREAPDVPQPKEKKTSSSWAMGTTSYPSLAIRGMAKDGTKAQSWTRGWLLKPDMTGSCE
jgi:hypothetical protein